MSFSIARTLTRPVSRMLAQSRSLQTGSKKCQSGILQKAGGMVSSQRGFTRSLWYLCRESRDHRHNLHKTCGCCAIHTEGDKEFSEFLSEEIKFEEQNEKSPGQLPSIDGFEITKSDGAEVLLTRKSNGEIITVRFNVNHSVDDDSLYDEAASEKSEDSQMVSKPAFVVEINKGGEETLHIQCAYPPPDAGPQEGQEYEDAIEIQEVTMTKSGGEWTEKQYVVAGSNMDGNMYDMLLNMLEERGVDGNFTDQLVEFATSYEHKQYIAFLNQLQNFTSK